MLRFVARHGLVRVIGGRAVPVLLAWDLLRLADKTRRIPIVDRNLRRAARNTRRRLEAAGAAAAAKRAGRGDEPDGPDVPAT